MRKAFLSRLETSELCPPFFRTLEKCCQVQLLAEAAGKPVKISDKDAENTWKTVGGVAGGWFSGLVQFEALERREAALPPHLWLDEGKFISDLAKKALVHTNGQAQ